MQKRPKKSTTRPKKKLSPKKCRTALFLFLPLSLVAQVPHADLSRLSSDDRASIESACYLAKNLHGPAVYRSCVEEQLQALSGSRPPDLSKLSSDDRASIESACYQGTSTP